MKAPEKIYLSKDSIESIPNDDPLLQILSIKEDDDIEYTRTDVFIEKAEGWLREVQKGFILTDKDITDFVNCMKGE